VESPPPTELTPADTAYHDNLQGTTTPPAEPEPVSEPVADEPDDVAAEEPAQAPAPPVVRPAPAVPPAAAPPAPAVASTAKPQPAADGWFLQVGAYRSRPNADRQAQALTAKGYSATVAGGAAGSLYRVRVGPFTDRPEAMRAQSRLRSEEGLGSSVTR